MSKLYLTAAEADEAARRAIRWLCTSVQQQDVVETEEVVGNKWDNPELLEATP